MKSTGAIYGDKNHTPTLLQQLKARITGNTLGTTPFFLMPVRLETRFMKDVSREILVDKTALSGDTLTEIKGTKTTIDIYGVFDGFTDETTVLAAQEIKDKITGVKNILVNTAEANIVDKSVLNKLQGDLAATLTTTQAYLSDKCSDPVLNVQLNTLLDHAASDVQQMSTLIQNIPVADNWQTEVSVDALEMETQLNSVVQNNATHLNNVFDGSSILNDTAFNSFIQSSEQLFGIFNFFATLDKDDVQNENPNVSNKIFLWTFLKQINIQLSELFGILEGNPSHGEPVVITNAGQYIRDIVQLATGLENAWRDLNDLGGKSRFHSISEPSTITEDEIDSLDPEAVNIGTLIENETTQVSGTLQQLRDAVFFEDGVADFVANMENVAGILDDLPQLEGKSLMFVASKLAVLDQQITELTDYINTGANTVYDQRLSLLREMRNELFFILNNITDPEPLTPEELSSLPQNIINKGYQIDDNRMESDYIASAIINGSPESPDALGSYQAFIDDTFQNIPTLLDTPEGKYLWFKLEPLVEQLGALTAHYSGKKLSDATILTLTGTVKEVPTDISYKWDKVIPINYKPIDWFSPFVIQDELWIRVYPDDIFIHSHEPKLTLQEKQAGIDYWNEWYNAKNDPKLQLAAWKALVNLYGVERAAWIIKTMFPTNFSTNSNGGTQSSTPNSFSPVKTQLTLLTSYVGQLNDISWQASEKEQLQPHIDFLTPHVQGIYTAVNSIDSLPAAEKTLLVADTEAFANTFSSFGDTVAVVYEGATPVSWGETAFMADQLVTVANGITPAPSWAVIYNSPPTFPTVQLKDTAWTETARSHVMPDRFLFALANNAANNGAVFKHTKVGNKIPDPLYVGITPKADPNNPDPFKNIPATNNLEVNDSKIKWMFDFNEAVNKGMATYIPISSADMQNGFDKLLVLGVRGGEGITIIPGGTTLAQYLKDTSKTLLEQLLDNHHYTTGFGFIRLGTPTNNTDTGNAGYKEDDPFGEISWKIQASNPLFTPTTTKLERRDGQVLADALGIEYSVLYNVDHADKKQISNAIAMNRALWPGTIGSHMSEMLNQLFTSDNVDRTKAYFTDYVLGRGALPPIRVGRQPYGILPVTSFGYWQWWEKFNGNNVDLSYKSPKEYPYYAYTDTNPNINWGLGNKIPSHANDFFQDRYNKKISAAFDILNRTWLQMVDQHVKTVDKTPGSTDAQKDFIEMLGLDALTAEAASRFMINDMTQYHAYMAGGSFTSANDLNPVQNKWNHPNGLGVPQMYTPDIPSLFTSLFKDFKFFQPNYTLGTQYGIFDHTNMPSNSIFISGVQFYDPIIPPYIQRLLRAFRLLQYDKSFGLRGPTVDEKLLSETDPITALISGSNFITWLTTAKPEAIWLDNQFGAMQSRSLLFLLMRQSMLLTYRNLACKALVDANFFDKQVMRMIGTPEGISSQFAASNNGLILTKWHLLFNPIDVMDGHPGYINSYSHFSTLNNSNTPSSTFPVTQKLSNILSNPSGTSLVNTAPLTEVKNAFKALANESTAELDRLLREHIDLCTYRLDAWNYGMVNKRLWELRKADTGTRDKGIYLGAYGWLINLRPNKLEALAASKIPTGLNDSKAPTYYNASNLGFIHTPSITHALTAALLRCGYESEKNGADNRFGINLSSERVKVAISLLHGIRNGQTIGALLGYELERGLHERNASTLELDMYIAILRKAFPLVQQPDGQVSNTRDELTLTNVVDGVALLDHVKTKLDRKIIENPLNTLWEIYSNTSLLGAGVNYPFDIPDLPVSGTPEANAIMIEIDRLDNYIDALGDLLVAEGVFQVANGNMARSAAALEALTEGVNPPIPEVIDTPRTGIHLTHRMVSFIEPVLNSGQTSPWASVTALSPRSKAEPSINKWAANMLASPFPSTVLTVATFPDKVGCKIIYNDEDGQPVTFSIKLSQLQIQPIDLLYMVQDSDYTQELSKRISYYVRKNAGNYFTTPSATGIPQDVPLTIHLTDQGSVSGVVVSFHQVLALIANISALVRTGRWLKAADFVNTPDAQLSTNLYDRTELGNRLGHYNASDNKFDLYGIFLEFEDLLQYFTNTTWIADDTELATYKAKLDMAARFGVDFAFPLSAIESVVNNTEFIFALLETGVKVKDELLRRKQEASQLVIIAQDTFNTKDEEAIDKYLKAAAIIFGNEFKVLPQFRFTAYSGLQAGIAAQLITNVGGSNDILRPRTTAEVDMTMDDWLYALARVNDKADNIESLRLLAFDANAHLLKKVRPVQFPFVNTPAADYWLGTEWNPNTYTPSGDKLSVAVINYPQFSSSAQNHCGLFIDEWTEHIPFKEEMTGITFHYDQPNAKPPQNVLLAVNPEASNPAGSYAWTLEHLVHTMLDTIDMAKIRMVEPDHFKAVSPSTQHFEVFKWVLPAIGGEVTPHIVNNGEHVKYTGKNNLDSDDSTQQVSFEYNVNNNGVPVPGSYDPNGSSSPSGSSAMKMSNWADMDSDVILGDTDLQDLMTEQIEKTEILKLQNELNNNLMNL